MWYNTVYFPYVSGIFDLYEYGHHQQQDIICDEECNFIHSKQQKQLEAMTSVLLMMIVLIKV